MIDLGKKNSCICKKINNTQKDCLNQYTISEQGKSVKLVPKTSEKVMAIIIDKCIIDDNNTKCDALFLYHKKTNKYSFLIELKGFGEIEKAFYQLNYTKNKREEYKHIINKFYDIDKRQVNQKFAIVSNGMLSKSELEKLENQYKIRVKNILYCEGTTPIPDLKGLI